MAKVAQILLSDGLRRLFVQVQNYINFFYCDTKLYKMLLGSPGEILSDLMGSREVREALLHWEGR